MQTVILSCISIFDSWCVDSLSTDLQLLTHEAELTADSTIIALIVLRTRYLCSSRLYGYRKHLFLYTNEPQNAEV
jgi:hypothetical protein